MNQALIVEFNYSVKEDARMLHSITDAKDTKVVSFKC